MPSLIAFGSWDEKIAVVTITIACRDLDAKKNWAGSEAEETIVQMKDAIRNLLVVRANAGKAKDFVHLVRTVFQDLNAKKEINGTYFRKKIIVQRISGVGTAKNSLHGYKRLMKLEV